MYSDVRRNHHGGVETDKTQAFLLMRISLVGTGRVSRVIGDALVAKDARVVSVSGRDEVNCNDLAKKLNCASLKLNQPLPDPDIVVIAVTDNAIGEVSNLLHESDAVYVHTSGNTPKDVLKKHVKHGVLWPIQSLVDPPVDFSAVPFLIEGNSVDDLTIVRSLAERLSGNVVEADLEKRQVLHLTAVLTSNFPVYLMNEAGRILNQHELSSNLLLPLWQGMAERVYKEGDQARLTGPARRNDTQTIATHLRLLKDEPGLSAIYESLTRSILERFHGKADL
jgi:predicted short-subunit dehydrogenase-like oxidoreductase (DUF2520 family)